MDESLKKMVEDRKNYKETRKDRYKLDSKDRLSKILKKKIQTTMIGALSSIEQHLGFLWESDGTLTEDQKAMKAIYEQIRSEVLDKGNNQARNIDAELSQYEIEWLRYKVNIPVIASGGVGKIEDFKDGVLEGKVGALLAASVFHYGELSILEVKEFVRSSGVAVREQ